MTATTARHVRLLTLPLLVAGAACTPASRGPAATSAPAPVTTAAAAPAATAPQGTAYGKRAESRGAMVSTSQSQATDAALAVLRMGGNAVDAAVAAGFALSVVDPSQTGLGGGGAATVWMEKARRADHLSFYGRAGERAEWSDAPGQTTVDNAGRGAATPGMVHGLLTLHERHGRLPRAQVIAPAIALARDGFVVSPLLSRTINSARARVLAEPRAAALFMPNGEALRPGDRLAQPELAALLELISAAGADAFYRSAFAERLAYHVQERGGLITVRDIATYESTWMRPLCTDWRGHTVLGAPPPMGGSVVLAMLHLAEETGLTTPSAFTSYTDAPAMAPTFADILRSAQTDGQRWRGDPAALAVPARGVASRAFAVERAAALRDVMRNGVNVDTVRAGDPWDEDAQAPSSACEAIGPYAAAPRPAAPSDTALPNASSDNGVPSESFTSHLSVVDADGNAVAMTTTVGVLFGSGVFIDGVWLNSVGYNFDARTRGPNRYSNSTMSPTIVLDGHAVRLVVGAAGSQYIQPATAQITLRTLALGEDPWLAISAPRLHATWSSREVEVEPGFAPDVYAALVARGYRPLSRVADIQFGGVHAVYVAPDGRRIGVADPRRDGVAKGQ